MMCLQLKQMPEPHGQEPLTQQIKLDELCGETEIFPWSVFYGHGFAEVSSNYRWQAVQQTRFQNNVIFPKKTQWLAAATRLLQRQDVLDADLFSSPL